MPHISANVRQEHIDALKNEQRKSGAPVSVQVRRALDKYFAAAQEIQKADTNGDAA